LTKVLFLKKNKEDRIWDEKDQRSFGWLAPNTRSFSLLQVQVPVLSAGANA
jgi:hypothetical protein